MRRICYVVGSLLVMLFAALAIIAGTPAAGPAATSESKPGLSSAAAPATGTDQAAVAEGQKLYEANCAVCHKADGSGGVKLGKAVSADLRGPDLEKAYQTDARLRRAILNGKDEKGKPLAPVMPRWQGTLSAKDVNAIIAYLKTLRE